MKKIYLYVLWANIRVFSQFFSRQEAHSLLLSYRIYQQCLAYNMLIAKRIDVLLIIRHFYKERTSYTDLATQPARHTNVW